MVNAVGISAHRQSQVRIRPSIACHIHTHIIVVRRIINRVARTNNAAQ